MGQIIEHGELMVTRFTKRLLQYMQMDMPMTITMNSPSAFLSIEAQIEAYKVECNSGIYIKHECGELIVDLQKDIHLKYDPDEDVFRVQTEEVEFCFC